MQPYSSTTRLSPATTRHVHFNGFILLPSTTVAASPPMSRREGGHDDSSGGSLQRPEHFLFDLRVEGLFRRGFRFAHDGRVFEHALLARLLQPQHHRAATDAPLRVV